MIDWINCSCAGVNADCWYNNPKLDFQTLISEITGELLTKRSEAQYKGLRFVMSNGLPTSIRGSLHQFKNPDGNNWNDFTFPELVTTLTSLQNDFGISLSETPIHSIEIGVNLHLNHPVKQFLNGVICHKGNAFVRLNKADKNVGVVCEYNEYNIKFYYKSYQSQSANTPENILRYEIKIKRMRSIEQYNIRVLADLQDCEKVAGLMNLLLDRLNEIIFFDFGLPTNGMTKFQRLCWERYNNPHYWENLNRNTLYKARKQFESLIEKYGATNIGEKVFKIVSMKYTELMTLSGKTGDVFTGILEGVKAQEPATFSHLECHVNMSPLDTENTEGNFEGEKEEKKATPRKLFCVSCRRDISNQRKGSRFCSERDFGKEAKRCRNKDSNRRMIIKRKIKNAMEKEFYLKITYTDTDNRSFTDTLSPCELSLTKEWLDRVTSVTVCKEQSETLTGKEATKFLTSKQSENELH